MVAPAVGTIDPVLRAHALAARGYMPPDEGDALHDAADPADAAALFLGRATTRVVYDVSRFYRTRLALIKSAASLA